MMQKITDKWWRGAVVYQVYPRSFADSNADGIGDLRGIIQKLDYIKSLNVDAIWISPFLKSPQDDYGYDVSDYETVDPMFGNNADFDELLEEAHKRGLKVLMDLVLSHTSSEHIWFKESRLDRKNPKADWYIWADPKPDGSPPNNWLCRFNQRSGWTWDAGRRQYYFHNWLPTQPDLNYHNPDVQAAALAIIRHWLEKGVDGFRFDVANMYFQDKQLRDNPPFKEGDPKFDDVWETSPMYLQRQLYNKTQPENLEFIKKVRKLLDEYGATTSIGEVCDDDNLRVAAQYTEGDQHLHMSYSPALLRPETNNAPTVNAVFNIMNNEFPNSWPMWTTGNHDVMRLATRWGAKQTPATPAQLKTIIALFATMRGSFLLYQGDELGLPEVLDMPLEVLRDPLGIALYPESPGRDGCRVPLPWAKGAENAGFTVGQPWLPVPRHYHGYAADTQEADEHSLLNFIRTFFQWRKEQPALLQGDLTLLKNLPEGVVGFIRETDSQKFTLLFNLSDKTCVLKQADLPCKIKARGGMAPHSISLSGEGAKLPPWTYCIVS